MEIAIRRAYAAEADELTSLIHASKRHWTYPEEWIHLWRDELTVTPDFITAHEVYVAMRAQERIGVCAVVLRGSRGELEHLWVLPEEMNRGVGRQLLLHALRIARSHGVQLLELTADPNAEGFYLKMGARRIAMVESTPAGRRIPRLIFELEADDALEAGEGGEADPGDAAETRRGGNCGDGGTIP